MKTKSKNIEKIPTWAIPAIINDDKTELEV